MRTQVRVFGSVMMLAVLVDVFLTMREHFPPKWLPVRRWKMRYSAKGWSVLRDAKHNVDVTPMSPPVRRAAQIDPIARADGDACAHEAAAAIEAVLDQRCPELKRPFWNAIDKLYRMDNGPDRRCPAAPGPNPEARMPA